MLVTIASACSDDDDDAAVLSSADTTTAAAPAPTGTSATGAGMAISSTAFAEGEHIPERYTCDGEDVSPPLRLAGVPPGATSLVLTMEDPDADGTWDHWVAYDIGVTDTVEEDVGSLGSAGENSWGRTGYGGPCPPSGTHRYVFTVYALDTELGLAEGASKAEVLDAMEGHVLAQAALTGRYGQ